MKLTGRIPTAIAGLVVLVIVVATSLIIARSARMVLDAERRQTNLELQQQREETERAILAECELRRELRLTFIDVVNIALATPDESATPEDRARREGIRTHIIERLQDVPFDGDCRAILEAAERGDPAVRVGDGG